MPGCSLDVNLMGIRVLRQLQDDYPDRCPDSMKRMLERRIRQHQRGVRGLSDSVYRDTRSQFATGKGRAVLRARRFMARYGSSGYSRVCRIFRISLPGRLNRRVVFPLNLV